MMLVTDVHNVTWLTGFTGDSSYLLLGSGTAVMISDSRYEIQLDEECPELEREIRTARINLPDFAVETVRKLGPKRLALEAHRLTKSEWDQFAAALDAELIGTTGLTEELRAVKDEFEITTIRRAIRIAERAFEAIRARLVPGQTEREIAHELEHQIRALGGSGCAFEPIVGVGKRGALPHGRPSEATAGEAPFMLIDWGARYNGYASDLTRVLATGRITPKLKRLYGIVLAAQQAAIDAIRPGAAMSEVDRAARDVIREARLGKRFGHGLGHGFGLQIHELPRLAPNIQGTLRPGMVITVEPGVYLPDWGGIRIEDDVLVTPGGCEVLSSLPRELEANIVSW
jgi:Xaa-Pro aminopeptidase